LHSQTALKQFQNLSAAARCCLEIYNLAGQLATLDVVSYATDYTTAKQAHYWGYWTKYLKAIELDDDPFLTTFS
jgi:hypothetical protein